MNSIIQKLLKNSFLMLSLIMVPQLASANNTGIQIYVMDGQLVSRDFKVYIPDREISEGMNPRLYLTKPGHSFEVIPHLIATNQHWIENKKGTDITFSGTILLFDISNYPVKWYSSGARVFPFLSWSDTGDSLSDPIKLTALNDNDIYIGNVTGSVIWTILLFIIFFFIVFLLTRHDDKGILGLLGTVDGSLSLSLFQMALWTLAVGLMVLVFGLMQLKVPDIPDSLIYLMGLSAGTSAFGHYQAHKLQKNSKNIPDSKANSGDQSNGWKKWQTLLMICVRGQLEPSLAKTQMLFWTLIILFVFIIKSFTEGKLWDVPNQLVFLMGISQAAFLGRKQMAVYELPKNGDK